MPRDLVAEASGPRDLLADESPNVAVDVAKSLASGVQKGAVAIPGMTGDVRQLGAYGIEKATGYELPEMPEKVWKPAWMPDYMQPLSEPVRDPSGTAEIQATLERAGMPVHEPQTTAGRYAGTVGEFTPAALAGPGTMARKLLGYAALPGAMSEGAGHATEGTAAEPWMRALGGLGGLGIGAAARMPQSMRPSRRVLAENLDAEGARRVKELGPEAMTLEATPGTLGLAQGVGIRPGGAQNWLVRQLEARRAGANPRIRSDIDGALGPAVVPSRVENALRGQRRIVGEQYDVVRGQAGIVNPREIVGRVEVLSRHAKGKTAKALKRVRDMLQPKQTGGLTDRATDISPEGLHETRQAIDAMIEGAEGTVKARLIDIRKLTDDELARSVTGIKNVDAAYADLKRQSKALIYGQSVLGTGKTAVRPFDLDQTLKAMSKGERARVLQGVRAEIDRIVGTKANDVQAMKGLIQGDGDWNRQKLISLFGGAKAKRIFDAVEREVVFADTWNKVVQNSQTAQRTAGAQAVSRGVGDQPVPPIWERVGQFPEWAGRAIANKIAGGALDRRDVRLAKLLTAKGAERDAIIGDLLGLANQSRVPWVPGANQVMSLARDVTNQ